MKLLYLYYNQPQAIENLKSIGYDQIENEIIFIDDGSDEPLKLDWKNATVYRIEEDVHWNQPVANNFGFSKLDDNDIIFRSDIDHYIHPNDLQAFNKEFAEIPPNTLYQFNRILNGNKDLKYPPNIYVARIGDIKKIGGYDERFAGNYGCDDKDFLYRWSKIYNYDIIVHSTLKVHVRSDLFTRNLNRDTFTNKALFDKIKCGQIPYKR